MGWGGGAQRRGTRTGTSAIQMYSGRRPTRPGVLIGRCDCGSMLQGGRDEKERKKQKTTAEVFCLVVGRGLEKPCVTIAPPVCPLEERDRK